jgi:uncharacterized DUF497 family protein
MPYFEWDAAKAGSNLRKHGVAFEDAITVFDDDRALEESDPDPDEERFKIIGMTSARRIVVVVYAEPDHDKIRIISARKATSHEIQAYRQG